MTYRDQGDAMRAKIAVLEEQAVRVGELEAKIARLEAEKAALEAEVARLRPPPRPARSPGPEPNAKARTPRELTFRLTDNAGTRDISLAQETIKIGRLSSSHIRLDDDDVSRMHAFIENGPGAVSIIDLGSSDGTHVNGERVQKQNLRSGDEIQVGASTIRVWFDE